MQTYPRHLLLSLWSSTNFINSSVASSCWVPAYAKPSDMMEQDRRSSISVLLRPAVSSRYSRMISRVGSLSGTYLKHQWNYVQFYHRRLQVRTHIRVRKTECIRITTRQNTSKANTNTLEVQIPSPKTAPAFTFKSSEYLNHDEQKINVSRINRGEKSRQQQRVKLAGYFRIGRKAYKKTSMLLNPSRVSHWLTMPSEAPTLSFPASLLRSTQLGFPACALQRR